jgi:RimJ/RimL family protein N-acetyltransferase
MLAEEGIRHLWIYVENCNTASRRGIEKADFEYHGNLSLLSVFGLTRRRGSVVGVNA